MILPSVWDPKITCIACFNLGRNRMCYIRKKSAVWSPIGNLRDSFTEELTPYIFAEKVLHTPKEQ